MPRIPQSEFNSTPSTRVGRINAPAIGTTGVDRAMKAGTQVMQGIAQLKDQQERTDAFLTASDAKDNYQQKKATFDVALGAADAKGNYTYPNPEDDKSTISGNIHEDYKGLQATYNEGMESTKGLTRSDIAGDMVHKGIGGDLLNTRVHMGKQMVRKQQSAVLNTQLNNVEKAFSDILNMDLTSSNAGSKADLVLNELTNQVAQTSPIMGTANTDKMGTLMDNKLNATATAVLNKGVSNGSVAMAEKLISKIANPMARGLAESRLEGKKKHATDVQNLQTMRKVDTISSTIQKNGWAEDQDLMAMGNAMTKLKNSYIDPNDPDSVLTVERRDEMLTQYGSVLSAQKVFQENLDVMLDGSMEEGGERFLASVEAEVDKQITAGGLADLITSSPEYKQSMVKQTAGRLKSLYSNLSNTGVGLLRKKYPDATKEELWTRADKMGKDMKLGYMDLAEDKDGTVFRGELKESMAVGKAEAFNTVTSAIGNAGDKSRRVAMALVGKDKGLSFIAVAGDMQGSGDMEGANQIIADATFVKNISLKEIPVSDGELNIGKLHKAFSAIEEKNFIGKTDNMFDEGMKQAIYNRATNILADGEETKVGSAMAKATEWFESKYSAVAAEEGRWRFRSTKFKSSSEKASVARGMERAATLPSLSVAKKRALVARLNLGGVAPSMVKKLSGEDIGHILKRAMTISPSTHEPNKMDVMVGGQPVILDRQTGEALQYTDQQIHDLGLEAKAKSETAVWERR